MSEWIRSRRPEQGELSGAEMAFHGGLIGRTTGAGTIQNYPPSSTVGGLLSQFAMHGAGRVGLLSRTGKGTGKQGAKGNE